MNQVDKRLLVLSARALYKDALAEGDPFVVRQTTRNLLIVLKTAYPQYDMKLMLTCTPVLGLPDRPRADMDPYKGMIEGDQVPPLPT